MGNIFRNNEEVSREIFEETIVLREMINRKVSYYEISEQTYLLRTLIRQRCNTPSGQRMDDVHIEQLRNRYPATLAEINIKNN